MRKLILLVVVATVISFAACTNSAEKSEKDAIENATVVVEETTEDLSENVVESGEELEEAIEEAVTEAED